MFSSHTILIFLLDSGSLLGPQHDFVRAYFRPNHKSALVRQCIVIVSLAEFRIMFVPAFGAVLRIQVPVLLVVALQIATVVVLESMLLDLLGAGIIRIRAIISMGKTWDALVGGHQRRSLALNDRLLNHDFLL